MRWSATAFTRGTFLRSRRIRSHTSRSGKRWVVPKGCMEAGKSAGEIALQEAWEEAGVEGKLCDTCLGVFSYQKIMPEDQSFPCTVAIYGLRV